MREICDYERIGDKDCTQYPSLFSQNKETKGIAVFASNLRYLPSKV